MNLHLQKYKSIQKIFLQNKIFFPLLFGLIIFLFRNAFILRFFKDDYYFLHLSEAKNILDFIQFFNPIRDFFYRPLSSEVFYSVIHALGNSPFSGHVIVFATFFIGLFFLYKIIKILSNNDSLAKLSVFLYSIHFTHVFQLYWLATFQEVALFTGLTISFYFFLKKKLFLMLFFFLFALLSKEQAIIYVLFIAVFITLNKNFRSKQFIYQLISVILLTFLFLGIYSLSLLRISQSPEYAIHLNPRLFINNFLWYTLWSFGLPNFMPDYLSSIFSKPLPIFWKVIKPANIQYYLLTLIGFLATSFIGLIAVIFYLKKGLKKYFVPIAIIISGYVIFLAPTLFIVHKWMVRLTIPLLFISIILALVIVELYKRSFFSRSVAVVIVILYLILNFKGAQVHESSSTYVLENRIARNTEEYFKTHKELIKKYSSIYLKDEKLAKNRPWEGSKKLIISFYGQNFIYYYIPGYKGKVIYEFENKKIPAGAYILHANDLLK